jgi:hypothetical protein
MDELQRLTELLAESLERVKRQRTALEGFRRIDADPAVPPERLRKAAQGLASEVNETTAAIGASLEESSALANRLGEERGPGPKPVPAADLAKGFRSVIQTIQREAFDEAVGDVGTTLKALDIELKGLIVVEDNEARVVPPAPGAEIDAGQLSTIRMSFASVPLMRAPEPVTPEQPPGPRRARAAAPTGDRRRRRGPSR